jgi:uncharacterized C2H2 Zn-finger protein
MTLKNSMGIFLYECPVCGKISKSWQSMSRHVRKNHKGLKMHDVKRISTRTYEYSELKVEEDD